MGKIKYFKIYIKKMENCNKIEFKTYDYAVIFPTVLFSNHDVVLIYWLIN